MAVNDLVDLIEHGDVAVELVADLHAELPLAADGLAEAVELLVLLLEDLGMVGVQLLVVEQLGVVAVAGRVVPDIRVVAVGAKEVVGGLLLLLGRVAEADGLGVLLGGGGGGAGEVAGEGRGVGAGERGRGGRVGEAVELGGEVVELLLERCDGVADCRGAAGMVFVSEAVS